jgi:transcriptional regulator with XRE-family HTH domain
MDLKSYLTMKDIRGKDAAEALEISESMLSMIARNLATPSLPLARRIYLWSGGLVDFLDPARAESTGDGEESA